MLSIKLADTMRDYDDILNMLYEYIIELHDIDDSVEIRTKDELKREYFYGVETLFYIERVDKYPIGFGIVCVGNSSHPSADIYINEFYVSPNFRNKGYGRALFNHIVKDRKRICFYILVKNKNAECFWKHLLKGSEWKDVSNIYKDMFDDPSLKWNIYENTEG